jgi:hypothetical protein
MSFFFFFSFFSYKIREGGVGSGRGAVAMKEDKRVNMVPVETILGTGRAA